GTDVIAPLVAAAAFAAPSLTGLTVSNGSAPFAGDGRLLTTISPNGDGFRDRALVDFRLNERATVRLDVVRTDQTGEQGSTQVVATKTVRLAKGAARIVWAPAPSIQPRTYVLRLTVTDTRGHTRVYGAYGPGRRPNAPVV